MGAQGDVDLKQNQRLGPSSSAAFAKSRRGSRLRGSATPRIPEQWPGTTISPGGCLACLRVSSNSVNPPLGTRQALNDRVCSAGRPICLLCVGILSSSYYFFIPPHLREDLSHLELLAMTTPDSHSLAFCGFCRLNVSLLSTSTASCLTSVLICTFFNF